MNSKFFLLIATVFWLPLKSFTKTNNVADTLTFIDTRLQVLTKEKEIKAVLKVNYVPFENKQTNINLYLSSDFNLDKVEGDNIRDYIFDRNASPLPTVRVNFKNPLLKGRHYKFTISYSGKPQRGFWMDDYQWIDLDSDFFIFPAFTNFQRFRYKLAASIDDPTYKFVDRDKLALSNALELAPARADYCYPSISACKTLKFNKFKDGNTELTVISNKPDSAVQWLGKTALNIASYYNSTFGKTDQRNQFAVMCKPIPSSVNPLQKTDGTFIVLADDVDESVLAHEISHFWWTRGNHSTMDKWLTESFAVYSQLRYWRQSKNQEIFDKEIASLKERSDKLPGLLKAERFGPYGSELIYVKGPYLLYWLEKKIGEAKFIELLVSLNTRNVSNTQEFLSELERVSNAAIRDEFEKLLN